MQITDKNCKLLHYLFDKAKKKKNPPSLVHCYLISYSRNKTQTCVCVSNFQMPL